MTSFHPGVGVNKDVKTSPIEDTTSCTRRMKPCFLGLACESKYFKRTPSTSWTSFAPTSLKSIASSVSPRNVNTPNRASSPSNASIALPSANFTSSQYSSPAPFKSTIATIARAFLRDVPAVEASFRTARRRQSFASSVSEASSVSTSLLPSEIVSTATSNSYVSPDISGSA